MNTSKTLNLVIVLSAMFSLIASAAQYKMIKSGASLTTNSTDVIEVTAHGRSSSGYLEMTLAGGSDIYSLPLDGGTQMSGSTQPLPQDRTGNVVTGVQSIRAVGVWVTVKITPADGTSLTQPSNVAVIPNDANGQFQVILESSIDMVTWNPVNPGTFGGSAPSRFFRTRIVKLP